VQKLSRVEGGIGAVNIAHIEPYPDQTRQRLGEMSDDSVTPRLACSKLLRARGAFASRVLVGIRQGPISAPAKRPWGVQPPILGGRRCIRCVLAYAITSLLNRFDAGATRQPLVIAFTGAHPPAKISWSAGAEEWPDRRTVFGRSKRSIATALGGSVLSPHSADQ